MEIKNKLQRNTIVDHLGNPIASYLQSDGGYHLGVDMTQSVYVDALNSSMTNLDAGNSFTFTGQWVSTRGVNGIQVTLRADIPCMVYVEQSIDGIECDISNAFEFELDGGLSHTVQAVSSYYRTRIVAKTATSLFRLQSILCPVVSSIPRALTRNGFFKIASPTDEYGWAAENTPMGEQRTAEVIRLAGQAFNGVTTSDPNFWTPVVTGSGSHTLGNAKLIQSTGTTANSTASYQSVKKARYTGGSAMRYRAVHQQNTIPTENNIRNWGAFDSLNGVFFQLNGTTFNLVTRKGGVDTAIPQSLWTGSDFTLDTLSHTYEIYWTNTSVWFSIDGETVHKESFLDDTWSDSMSHYVRMSNRNINGSTTPVTQTCRTATIYIMGKLETDSRSKYINTNTTTILKYSAGRIHSILNCDNAGSITLYDNYAASGTIIAIIDSAKVLGSLDFHTAFNTGLTIVTSGGAKVVVIYE